eukprot:gene14706-biopygen2101
MARDTPPDRISATLRRQRQRRLPRPRGGGGGVTDDASIHFHWNTLRGDTAAEASPPSNSFSSVDSREGEGPCMHFRVRDPPCACSERLRPAKKMRDHNPTRHWKTGCAPDSSSAVSAGCVCRLSCNSGRCRP